MLVLSFRDGLFTINPLAKELGVSFSCAGSLQGTEESLYLF